MICPNCGHDNLPGSDECSHCEQALTSLDLPTPTDQVERSLMEDVVRTLQSKAIYTMQPDASIREAIQLMLEKNIGAVLVSEDRKLVGIFSERDLLKKIAGIHDNYDELRLGDYMTPNPETVEPGDPLNFALHRMDVGGYRHMPVVENETPLGMISVRDMLRHITNVCQDL